MPHCCLKNREKLLSLGKLVRRATSVMDMSVFRRKYLIYASRTSAFRLWKEVPYSSLSTRLSWLVLRWSRSHSSSCFSLSSSSR